MQAHDQITTLVRERTWNKELILWFGPEGKLRPVLEGIQIRDIDLLDLFTAAEMPSEDDDIRQHISRSLRQYLKSIPRVAKTRDVLIVRSSGLLARYPADSGVTSLRREFQVSCRQIIENAEMIP